MREAWGPGKKHRDAEIADSKELWKSVEKVKVPPLSHGAKGAGEVAPRYQNFARLREKG